MYSLARVFGFEAFWAAGFCPGPSLQKIVYPLLQLINECNIRLVCLFTKYKTPIRIRAILVVLVSFIIYWLEAPIDITKE
jgi:hypothetical protein